MATLKGITIATILLMSVSMAHADTIMTYTGLNFTFGNAPYSAANHMIITLDLAAPLPPLVGPPPQDFQVDPLSFKISDGIDTITNLTATSSFFDFETFADDSIEGWFIDVATPTLDLNSTGGAKVEGADPCSDCVRTFVPGPLDGVDIAGVAGSPGQWVIPEPLSLISILLALVIIAFFHWTVRSVGEVHDATHEFRFDGSVDLRRGCGSSL